MNKHYNECLPYERTYQMKILSTFSIIILSQIAINGNLAWAAEAPAAPPAAVREEKKARVPTSVAQLTLPATLTIEGETYYKHVSIKHKVISYMRGSATIPNKNLLHYTFHPIIAKGVLNFHITPAGRPPHKHIYFNYTIGSASDQPTYIRRVPATAVISDPLERSLNRLSTLFITALKGQGAF